MAGAKCASLLCCLGEIWLCYSTEFQGLKSDPLHCWALSDFCQFVLQPVKMATSYLWALLRVLLALLCLAWWPHLSALLLLRRFSAEVGWGSWALSLIAACCFLPELMQLLSDKGNIKAEWCDCLWGEDLILLASSNVYRSIWTGEMEEKGRQA